MLNSSKAPGLNQRSAGEYLGQSLCLFQHFSAPFSTFRHYNLLCDLLYDPAEMRTEFFHDSHRLTPLILPAIRSRPSGISLVAFFSGISQSAPTSSWAPRKNLVGAFFPLVIFFFSSPSSHIFGLFPPPSSLQRHSSLGQLPTSLSSTSTLIPQSTSTMSTYALSTSHKEVRPPYLVLWACLPDLMRPMY